MTAVHPNDIFNFAVYIEEDGEQFYRAQADVLGNSDIKDLFSQLADDEAEHKKVFTEMFADVEKIKPFENYPGEYQEYLREYADTLVFKREQVKTEAASVKTPADALQFAMQRELDSIAYYQELKELVGEKDRKILDQVISEERKHFAKLAKLKTAL